MATRTSVTDLNRNLSDYINRVTYRGERFVLTRGGRDVAELVPTVTVGRPLADLPSILESLPRLGDEEARRFAEDLDDMRRGGPPDDPWES